MTEDRAVRAFGTFDLPVKPDPAFAETLFAELTTELGFGAAPGKRRVPRLRIREALGLDRLPTGTTAWRLAYLAAIIGLLFALGLGAMIVGGMLSRPNPLELVRLARAAIADPPALTMSVRDPEGSIHVLSFDGSATWRSDVPTDALGNLAHYVLWDGKRFGEYFPSNESWQVTTVEQGAGPPLPLGTEFALMRWDEKLQATAPLPCDEATWIGREKVAGRETDHVYCADLDTDHWFDTATHLPLRFEAGPDTPNWGSGSTSKPVIEATSLEFGPQEAARFDWAGPPGAFDANNMPPSTLLAVGQPAPPLSGTTIDGTTWTTATGKPTAVLFTIPQGGGTHDALAAAVRDDPRFAGIVVNLTDQGTAAGYRTLHPTTAAVVADRDWALLGKWGLSYYPSLVLLDAQGIVRAIIPGHVSATDLPGMLEALAAGTAIPSPAPAPIQTEQPMPTDPVTDYVSSLDKGTLPEPWSAPLLGGGTLDSASLAGRPTFLLYWIPIAGDPNDPLPAFAALARAIGDEARFVVLAAGEPETGWVAERAKALGVDIPIAFDWDGRVSTVLRTGQAGTLLFDAGGRLADGAGGVPIRAVARRMLNGLAPAAGASTAPGASATPGGSAGPAPGASAASSP